MAEQSAAPAPVPDPNPCFLLRLRTADGERPVWIRRNLWCAGWSRTLLMEFATRFPTRVQAIAFAREQRIEAQVELVTVSSEEVRVA